MQGSRGPVVQVSRSQVVRGSRGLEFQGSKGKRVQGVQGSKGPGVQEIESPRVQKSKGPRVQVQGSKIYEMNTYGSLEFPHFYSVAIQVQAEFASFAHPFLLCRNVSEKQQEHDQPRLEAAGSRS